MNLDEFKDWLNRQLDLLADTEEFWQDDWQSAQRLIDHARDQCYALQLPNVAAICEHGPPRQVLAQVLAALPEPEYLDIHGVAELLRCCVRSVKRGLITGEFPQPAITVNSLQRWHREQF